MERRKHQGFQTQPIGLGMEIQASAHEVCRLLEFGGELAHARARRLSRHVTRTALQLERALGPTTSRAA